MNFAEIIAVMIVVPVTLYFIIDLIKVYKNEGSYKNSEHTASYEVVNDRAKAKEELKSQINELSEKYGKCSADINLGGWTDHTLKKRFLVFEESKLLIINESEYRFADILDYSMVDDATRETTTFSDGKTSTSTGSMIGRAVAGGIIGGGLGAVAGAATAKKNTYSDSFSETKNKHRYSIYINLNSFENPTLKLPIIESSDRAHQITSILNVITERNKQ